ncbi:helix-hairpin-helix domain-containing protein [Rhodocytophaga rosea]|uniref:Helix-hairpin-helix domain-containing protein n=1 Tax=Rhodocytophaga rosea TaxID=2704465 RepID=A0A6C0GG55_9BACT|nr:helix-hairpin-helix domain-containing protein [Rhodocytophaga rosea]QHT66889.1 helix-hairpin-helix domain-containing protein [Rhodocytophaga rosea]
MKKVNYWIRNVFGFDQRQTKGFRTITLLMLLLLALPFLYSLFLSQPASGITRDKVMLDSVMALLEKQSVSPVAVNTPIPPISKGVLLFDFNPNEIDATQWQSLGLPKYIAERIIKYRDKGGKFKTKKDVLKIYGFPPALYEQLYSHILLPDTLVYERKYEKEEKPVLAEKSKPAPFTKKEEKILSFNINKADTAELSQVRGIGPALSKRIIKYRDLLGGFINTAQIGEVYGLDSTVVKELLKYGYLEDNIPFRKLNVNTATVQELDAHPYITPKIAQIIVAYRQQHGKFASSENLYNIRVLDKTTLNKLLPYLSFE